MKDFQQTNIPTKRTLNWAGGGITSVEKQIQFFGPALVSFNSHSGGTLSWDILQASPYISGVVMHHLLLQVSPESVLDLPDFKSEFVINPLLLLPVPRNESPLLSVQQGFKVRGHPGLVIGETPYSPVRHSVLHTEVDVVCEALDQTINAISMRAAEYLPVCSLETVSLCPSLASLVHTFTDMFKLFLMFLDN